MRSVRPGRNRFQETQGAVGPQFQRSSLFGRAGRQFHVAVPDGVPAMQCARVSCAKRNMFANLVPSTRFSKCRNQRRPPGVSFRSFKTQRASRERLCASRGLTRPAAPERGPGRTCSRTSRSPIRHASAAMTAGLRLSSTMPQRHDHGVSTMGGRSRTRPATFSPPTRYDLSPRETNGRAWIWRRGHSCS